ncbi:MAG TPA: phosphatidylinositol kinase [Oceanospirillaceae bacterium]|nr:phosphatidylinositol kinase [Oceanospirillaceae bacterium]
MNNIATIQIYHSHQWHDAATIRSDTTVDGHNGGCYFEYVMAYALEYINPRYPLQGSIACTLPVTFDLLDLPHWPAVILDILPSGAGRAHWLKHLKLTDGDNADWPLLLHGAGSPPGSLRIKEAHAIRGSNQILPTADGALVRAQEHPGFELDDILHKQEHFIEYAYQHGAISTGASDVQGVAPKFLMCQDHAGRWHAEGVLPDEKIAGHYLVKFPRGKTASDRQLLKNEAAYMRVATQLGLKTHASKTPITWYPNALIIPRFDRKTIPNGQVERYAMESLCALAGIAKFGIEYGGQPSHNQLVDALVRYASQPTQEVIEYIKRDVVNIALGNTDNHARNTSILRNPSNTITLAPMYDFAPMYIDPEGVPRSCRWANTQEHAGQPDWRAVIEHLPLMVNKPNVRQALTNFISHLKDLPNIMQQAQVDHDIIERRSPSIQSQINALGQL